MGTEETSIHGSAFNAETDQPTCSGLDASQCPPPKGSLMIIPVIFLMITALKPDEHLHKGATAESIKRKFCYIADMTTFIKDYIIAPFLAGCAGMLAKLAGMAATLVVWWAGSPCGRRVSRKDKRAQGLLVLVPVGLSRTQRSIASAPAVENGRRLEDPELVVDVVSSHDVLILTAVAMETRTSEVPRFGGALA